MIEDILSSVNVDVTMLSKLVNEFEEPNAINGELPSGHSLLRQDLERLRASVENHYSSAAQYSNTRPVLRVMAANTPDSESVVGAVSSSMAYWR